MVTVLLLWSLPVSVKHDVQDFNTASTMIWSQQAYLDQTYWPAIVICLAGCGSGPCSVNPHPFIMFQ